MQAAVRQNIAGNGRIVIHKGGNRIFFLSEPHYNDIRKDNNPFTEGDFKMVKLNILNMERFLSTVNSCTGKVNMLCPDGKKVNINGEETDRKSTRLNSSH